MDRTFRTLDSKREYIRQYDNSKFSEPNWYGRKEYAHMTLSEVDARLEIGRAHV